MTMAIVILGVGKAFQTEIEIGTNGTTDMGDLGEVCSAVIARIRTVHAVFRRLG